MGEISMKIKNENRTKRKEKRKMIGWIIALVIVAAIGIGGANGWSRLSKEHVEAKNLPLDGADFGNLKDGTYMGEYDGGMYKWRTNKVQVTVSSGKVSDIKILEHKENQPPEFTGKLFGSVIEAQSLQVDTVSGATLTSKAYLKGIENALINAQK
jgi:uncharacterized protein with FMN-binding domain